MKSISLSILAMCLMLLSQAHRAQTHTPSNQNTKDRFEVIEYPNAIETTASAINNRGDIVGRIDLPGGKVTGFVFRNKKFELIEVPGAEFTYVQGINDHGHITGVSRLFRAGGRNTNTGYILKGGEFTPFTFPGAERTLPFKINSKGDLVGSYSRDGRTRGFLRRRNGEFLSLDYPDATLTYATGINDRGEIVGKWDSADGREHGFHWRNGVFKVLDVPDAARTLPDSINNRSDVVGRAIKGDGSVLGFYRRNGVFQTFSYPGAKRTVARGVNDNGDIVGPFEMPDGKRRGFVLRARPVDEVAGGGVIVFQHANVIDGLSREPLRDVTVTIANGKITGIQKNLKRAPAGAEVIDLKGKWLLPGYVDAHVHVNFEQAQRALRFGITTARTMGGGFIDIEIRNAHRQGRSDIPEVLASGYQVRPDVGNAPSFLKDFPELADMKPRVSGTENVRRLVRAFAAKGVDHIKVLATERAGTPDTDPLKRTFTDEELIAIVDEARKAGLKVAAHAHGDEGAYAAVKAGVRSIEHGTWLSDKTLALMEARGTWLVSNIFVDLDRPLGSIVSTNPILVERGRTMWPQAREVTRRAYEMGVHVVGATDLNYGREFDSGRWTIADNAAGLVGIGMPKMEAIKAITSEAAKLLEIDKRTGAIRKGLEADIVIVGDNPLSSIEALKDIRMIVNDGTVVFNKVDH